MDEQLKQLKKEYEQLVPISFTESDKEAVFSKIREKEKKTIYLWPHFLTALMVCTVLFLSFHVWESRLQSNAPTHSLDTTDASKIKEKYFVTIKDKDEPFLTFNEATIQVNDVIGGFSINSITHNKQQKTIMLEGNATITGNLYTDRNEFWFVPDEKSLTSIPIAAVDLDKKLFFSFSNEASSQLKQQFVTQSTGSSAYNKWYSNEPIITFEEYTVNLSTYTYNMSTQYSTIIMDIYPYDMIQTSIQLSDSLLSIYEQYRGVYDDSLLTGLEPIDIFKLYIHAMTLGDRETEYALLLKGEGVPDKETYLNDLFWTPTEETLENEKAFLEELKKQSTFSVQYLSENEVLILFDMNLEKMGFRLFRDSELDVWKVPLMAMQ